MEWDPFIENENEFNTRISFTIRVVPLRGPYFASKRRESFQSHDYHSDVDGMKSESVMSSYCSKVK
jgi:hypothetical protein